MRILRLRFRNLNSLAGEWCIDFTHPAYVSSGIFAITGPTGSGKTTILDAICLALYGQTPRLKNISGRTNEIMSRGTGECFAEVTYESELGQFSVHWSQWRARKKPDGELQPPKHEISDLRTKKVLETKLTRVLDKVVETTGLDYHQFTRSILLAQGDFATFLNADADERAPILEKITGTGIYSDISRKVHERNAAEAGRLTEVQREIEGLDLLSPEEEHDLKEDFKRYEAEIAGFSIQRITIREAISWLEGIQKLDADIAELEQKKAKVDRRRQETAADLGQLSRARRAFPIGELYSKTVRAREQFETVGGEVQEINEQLASAVSEHESALIDFGSRKTLLEGAQTAWDKERDVIKHVRDLDFRIREFDREVQERHVELNTIQERIRETCKAEDVALREQEGFSRDLESAVSYLEAHQADNRLSTDLSGFEQQLLQYSRLAARIEENSSLRSKHEETRHDLEQALKVYQDSLSTKEAELLARKSELQAMQAEFDQALDYHGAAFWRACESSLNKRKNTLESLIKVYEAVSRFDQRIEALRRERDTWYREAGLVNAELTVLNRERQLREDKVGLLEANLSLLMRVESLEEERERLEDGVPCPLCGSLEHPYASGNVPKADPVRQELEENRSDLRRITQQVEEKGVALSGLNVKIQSNEQKEQDTEEEIRIQLEGADMGFDDIRSMTMNYDMQGMLEKALRSCNAHHALCLDMCSYVNEREPFLANAKDQITLMKDALPGLRSTCIRAEADRDRCSDAVRDLGLCIGVDTTEMEVLSPVIHTTLQLYGLEPLAPGNAEEIIPALKERRTAYETKLSIRDTSRAGIEQCSIAILGYEKRIKEDKESEATLSSAIAGKTKVLTGLSVERTTRYGEKDPAIEEEKIEAQVRAAEEAFHAIDRTVTGLETRISELNMQVSRKSVQMDEIQVSLDDLEPRFAAGVLEAGFAGEADFVAARLPHDRFVFLENMERDLHTEETKVRSSLEEKQQLLNQEREKAVTGDSPETLETRDRECEGTIANINRKLGTITQDLKKQEELAATRGGLVTALKKQEAECARWQRLHDLIGSADGKKFRVFAQGLTFDRLIAHTNRHLRKMSDRYLLIRRPDSALELDIMDHYQAGELRTTKNLSGGESFIVSLALALGLSGMASRNVRIDSLFLDEGFGTLDDQTLETALDTLSGLQQEGKIIGIISHVPAIRERISTRIIVEKTSGGRSRLHAPGCRLMRP